MNKKIDNLIFENVTINHEPFKYFTVEKPLESELAEELLKVLESIEDWVKGEKEYFSLLAFRISKPPIRDEFQFLCSEAFQNKLLKLCENTFSTPLEKILGISAHKLTKGHGTAIHNDFLELSLRKEMDYFTHRFLIYLNKGWDEEDGGILGIFNSDDPEDIADLIFPIHNTGVGLAMGTKSQHAVSEMNSNTRYVLSFSMVSKSGDYEN